MLTYENFDLSIESTDAGTHWARVVSGPAGETGRVAFTTPFSSLELENFLLRIGRPRRAVRRIDSPENQAIKAFGERLYEALFHGAVQVSFERSLSEASARGAGLRVRLRLSSAPALAELPWEFLFDRTRQRFLCLSERTPLIRYLEVPDPPRPLLVTSPLRILVMISSPSDPRFAPLDVEREWSTLQEVFGDLRMAGKVHVERLEQPTLSALRRRLRTGTWHILHFIGHGGFDTRAQEGVVLLEDEDGRGRLVPAHMLGIPLHNHNALRLVTLNACEGARADPTDPFAGTAQTLIQQGIPAIVAMQFEITDPAAIKLTQELYGAVADGYPIDASLSQARGAIYTDVSVVEWATPVLYLRAPDGQIFDITSTPSREPVRPPIPTPGPRRPAEDRSRTDPGTPTSAVQTKPQADAADRPPGQRPRVDQNRPPHPADTPATAPRLTPTDVHNVAFKKPPIGKRGYDEEEVDALLDMVERDLQTRLDALARPGAFANLAVLLNADEVHRVAFKKPPIGKRGYDEEEVDTFLDEVEVCFRSLDQELAQRGVAVTRQA